MYFLRIILNMKTLIIFMKHINCFCKTAKTVLILGINLILPGLLALYFIIKDASASLTSDILIHIYAPMIEYYLMSIAIIVIGALLLDIAEKDIKNLKSKK